MSPGPKRQMAGEFVSAGRCSGRQICRYFRLHRSTFRFRARQLNAWMMRLKEAVRRVSGQYSQWGYAKVARLLQGEGWQVGKRLVQRLRRDLVLRVPTRRPRKRRVGMSTGLPTRARHRGHIWTWDFIHDGTVKGDAFPV